MRKILALAAVLSAVALTASANAAGSAKFCLNGPGTQSTCNYQTMAACEKAKKGSQTCVENPTATTGAGSSSSSSSSGSMSRQPMSPPGNGNSVK